MSRPLATTALKILTAASLLTFLGCSTLPTAPTSRSGAGRAGVGSTAVGQIPESPTDTTATVVPIVTTAPINGLLGGVVHAGVFTVAIPPAAFSGTAQVTVTQADPSRLVCELSISPASKNHFLLPVILTANCGGLLDKRLLSFSCISWFNPATGQWQKVPSSTVSLLNMTVQAPLSHFSQYRVEGRASW